MDKKEIRELAEKLIVNVTENYRAYYREEINGSDYSREIERIKDRFEELFQSQSDLAERNTQIELLESYSKYLEQNGYMDIDWRTEEPYAIDEFLNKNHG